MVSATSNSSAVDNPFQLLALTGGGYRGLFTASALACIENEIKRPIGRIFELSAGTSIGGIVALAIAFEVPMKKVVKVFRDYGSLIFPEQSRGSSGFFDYIRHKGRARYQTNCLVAAIEALIPKGTRLGDAVHPVLIPAVNLTQGRPQVFKTRHHNDFVRDWKYLVTEIALATSAAPTYFPLAKLDGQLYADGGLFANAPDLVCLHEAEHYFQKKIHEVRLLSVGTTTQKYSISSSAGVDFGLGKWMEDGRLFSVTISAQQQIVEQIVQHRLGGMYVRIDAEPSSEQSKDLGLDVATTAAADTLEALGKKRASDLLGTGLQPFLMHQAKDLILERLNG